VQHGTDLDGVRVQHGTDLPVVGATQLLQVLRLCPRLCSFGGQMMLVSELRQMMRPDAEPPAHATVESRRPSNESDQLKFRPCSMLTAD